MAYKSEPFSQRRPRACRPRQHLRPQKLRRRQQTAARAIATFVFIFILCYELFFLRVPLSHPSPSSPHARTAAPRSDRHASRASFMHPQPVSAANQLRSHQDVSTQQNSPPPVHHAEQPSNSQPQLHTPHSNKKSHTVSHFEPLKKRTHLKHHSLPPAALELENHAADEGDNSNDTDPPAISKKRLRERREIVSKSGKMPGKGSIPGAGQNFWQWFQETKGIDKEGTTAVSCPRDNERLCRMLYKYLRKYKIRSIYDVSCYQNLDWMALVLKKAGNALWGFKYYCNVAGEGYLASAKEKLGNLEYVEFVTDEWWRTGYAEGTELLFGWDVLPHIPYGRVWSFFVKAKTQNIKYILVDNYPGITNDPSPTRKYLNIRRHPFRFPAAKEVVQNVTEPGETEKRQLLFYESAMLPDNLQ